MTLPLLIEILEGIEKRFFNNRYFFIFLVNNQVNFTLNCNNK